jgi:hypothetical protein
MVSLSDIFHLGTCSVINHVKFSYTYIFRACLDVEGVISGLWRNFCMWRKFTGNMKSKKGVWRKRVSILALSSLFGQVGYNRGSGSAG